MLDQHRIALIRAPPFSGKSYIAMLLAHYLHDKGQNAVICSTIGKDILYTDIDQCWVNNTNKSWKEWFMSTSPTTLIIDEAQTWYDLGTNDPFWQAVIQQTNKSTLNPNLRLLFLSAYGERTGRDKSIDSGTPVNFETKNILNYDFLQLNFEEFYELMQS